MVRLWSIIIEQYGFGEPKALSVAENITSLLQQLYLSKAEHFYVRGALPKKDAERREIILERLGECETE